MATRCIGLAISSGAVLAGRLLKQGLTGCKQFVSEHRPSNMGQGGGVRSQLNRLRAGLHPVTRCRLPQATWADGSAVVAARGYLRKTGGAEAVDDKFVPYMADEVRMTELAPTVGKTASEKMRLLRGRVLLKLSGAARAARIARRKEESRSAADLVESCVRAVEAENGRDEAEAEMVLSDDSGAEFWNGLESMTTDRLHGIPSVPEKFSRGPNKPSRASRLMTSRSIVGKGCSGCYGSMACGCSNRSAM